MDSAGVERAGGTSGPAAAAGGGSQYWPQQGSAGDGYGRNPNFGVAPFPSDSEPPYKKARGVAAYAEAPPGSGYGGFGNTPPPAAPGTESYAPSNTLSYADPSGQSYAYSAPSYGDRSSQGYAATENYAPYTYQQQAASYGFSPPVYAPQDQPAFQQQRRYSGGTPGGGRGRGVLSSLFYKTKLCNNYKSGGCTFNENCSFAHGAEELRKPPAGWQQMLGSTADAAPGGRAEGGYTAAGQNGQRLTRSRPCRFFLEGNCPYGDRCSFAHDNSNGVEPRNPVSDNTRTRRASRWEQESQGYGIPAVIPADSTQLLNTKPDTSVTYDTRQAGDSVPFTNLNAYQNPIGESSLNFQDPNAAATTISHWDHGKKCDNLNNGAQQVTTYVPYGQSNSKEVWMPEYAAGQFSQSHIDDGVNQYPNQQQQKIPFFKAAAPEYATQRQDNTQYAQGEFQNEYS